MQQDALEILEKKEGKQLYDYQKEAIDQIFEKIKVNGSQYNLLYQLPTGGGKTVIFSEIAKRFIKENGKKVLILTHRIELCGQTSRTLNESGVRNKVISSKVQELPDQEQFSCFVAMVETLNNRLNDNKFKLDNIGLVIIDEAHYNSFRKMFRFFENKSILGVTATPLSSNVKLPMKENYDELIVGNSIAGLIEKGFLSKAHTYSYDVSLRSLKLGMNGDYTVKSSDMLYSDYSMLGKLIIAYEEKSLGKKTLIFNNGINASKEVQRSFEKAGYEIRHLDNTNTSQERKDILEWFKNKKDAILTSVSILTTGFDEPTVETIILNRATKSLTLYHQMIGRGSRVLPDKKNFTVIDLGNNSARFGLWEEYVDWQQIFISPDSYYDALISDEEIERYFKYVMSDDLRKRFEKTEDVEFDVLKVYKDVTRSGLKSKVTMDRSLEQHIEMCFINSEDVYDAIELSGLLEDDIEWRVKQYSYCITKSTQNYRQWLQDEYMRKLKLALRKKFDELDQE